MNIIASDSSTKNDNWFGVHTTNGKLQVIDTTAMDESNLDAKLNFMRTLSQLLGEYTKVVEITDSMKFWQYATTEELLEDFALYVLQECRIPTTNISRGSS
jgi:hypothetical protein